MTRYERARDAETTDRRTVLAGIGAVAAPATAAGRGGRDRSRWAHAVARRVLRATGSVRARHRVLEAAGVPTATTLHRATVTRPGSGGSIGSQALDEADLAIYLAMSRIAEGVYDVFLQWNWERQGLFDWGEAPRDLVGFAWDDGHYYFRSDEVFSSDRVRYRDASVAGGGEGVVFGFDDRLGDDGANYWAEVVARFDADTDERRQIKAEYVHTYSGLIDEIEVGFPDVISFYSDSDPERWESSRQLDGDPLLISPEHTSA